MADAPRRRSTEAVKPPQAVPRGYAPPLWQRLWITLKPPTPLGRTAARRRRNRIVFWVSLAIALVVANLAVRYFYSGAPAQRAPSILAEGTRLLSAGKYEQAVAQFTEAVRLSPGLAMAYYDRGLAHQNLNRTADAIQDFQLAVQADPNLGRAHAALGAIYLEQGDLQHAMLEATRAVSLEPSADNYEQRGQVYEAMGEHEKAIGDYNAAIAQDPSLPNFYRARALSKDRLGDHAGAKQDRAKANALERPGARD